MTLGSVHPLPVKSGVGAGLQGGPGKQVIHGVIKPYISIGL